MGIAPRAVWVGGMFQGGWRPVAAAPLARCVAAVGLAVTGVPALGQCPLFGEPALRTGGSQGEAIATGDFNRDGKPDVVIVGSVTTIVPGAGAGTFGAPTSYSVPGSSVALGDFNGDGVADLVVGGTGRVSILLGTGSGTFGAATNVPTGSGKTYVVAADIDRDGKLDIAATNSGIGGVAILPGLGDGTFGAAVSTAGVVSPSAIVVGDFNRDGKPDLVVVDTGTPRGVAIFLGTGATAPGAATKFSAGTEPASAVVGDFNWDGKPDLAVASSTGVTVSVLLGTGNGTFSGVLQFGTGGNAFGLGVDDFNGDGKPDLAVARSGAGISVLPGMGTGTFGSALHTLGTGAKSVAVGDFDEDGKPDLATVNFGSGFLVMLTSLAESQVVLAGHPNSQSVVAGGTVTFSVSVSRPYFGAGVAYQWRRNGTALGNGLLASGAVVSGATSPTLTISGAAMGDDGTAYDCVASNSCDTARSDPAGLRVTAAPPPPPPPMGACCHGTTCELAPGIGSCEQGAYLGNGSVCSPAGRGGSLNACCRADVDNNGVSNVQDVFTYLRAWFAGCP